MAQRLLISLLAFVCFFQANGQYFKKENALVNKVNTAVTDKEKVGALGNLAEFYYIYKADKKGDSVLQKQLLIAEISNDTALIKEALFGNAIMHLNEWTSIETFEKASAFLDKSLKYAESTGNEDYQAIAHIRKAFIYRKRGQYNLALQETTMALSNSNRSKNDSLRASVYLEVGNLFLAKGEPVPAFKNYNKGFDIAYSSKNVPLLSNAYHHFAEFYQSLSNKELTRQSLLKSLELNKKNSNEPGLLKDYMGLARLTDEKEYFDKVIQLSQKLGKENYVLYAKRLMFAYLMAVNKSSKEALHYLDTNEDLKQSYINTGHGNYYWMKGNVYRYSNQVDSALYYYTLAEPELQKSYDLSIRKTVCKGIAECYENSAMSQQAMTYYHQAFDVSRQQNDFHFLSTIAASLSQLYARAGNYQKAYEYSQQYLAFQDTLNTLSAQRDVVLMEIDQENKKRETDLAEAEASSLRLRNLQYMGISIAVAVLIILMVLSGMFPVSKFVVKMIGFVGFICLFEFVVLLIDSYIHNLAHGEPLKIWLFKIVIIGILLPLHHYTERIVVRFLASRQLMRFRQSLDLRRLVHKKKPAAFETASFEKINEKPY